MSDFPTAALALLSELPSLPAGWTTEHADRYRNDLLDPLRELVDELGDRLRADVAPGIVSEPAVRGSISPVQTDRRFAAPDTPAHKDHVLLRFWEGPKKQTAPTLFVRIGADGFGYASGVPLVKELRDRWRTAVADDAGDDVARILDELAAAEHEIAGDLLAKVPRPYDPDHPRAELLRRTGALQVRHLGPPPDGTGVGTVADQCAAALVTYAPLHRWLVANVGEG